MKNERECPICGSLFGRTQQYRANGTKAGWSDWAKTCSPECGVRYRYGDPDERFWSNVDKSAGPDECWPWLLGTDEKGYGKVRYQNEARSVSRVAYFLGNQLEEFPKEDVKSSCGSRVCCNPGHLFLDTPPEDKFCVICGKVIPRIPYYKPDGTFGGYGAYERNTTCGRECGGKLQTLNARASFWDKIDRSGGENSCWDWLKSKNERGYGTVQWDGKVQKTHRVAFYLASDLEEFPELDVLHACDNPPCCNPKHLFLGTHEDNMRDMLSKGRRSRIKLSRTKAEEIRNLYTQGLSQQEIADRYDVSQKQISRILLNETWTI